MAEKRFQKLNARHILFPTPAGRKASLQSMGLPDSPCPNQGDQLPYPYHPTVTERVQADDVFHHLLVQAPGKKRTDPMSRTPLQLREGIPRQDEYDTLLRSAVFNDMEAFSEQFLERNRGVLRGYIARWGAENPFHSWSRLWEIL